jgi:hypothetical protein
MTTKRKPANGHSVMAINLNELALETLEFVIGDEVFTAIVDFPTPMLFRLQDLLKAYLAAVNGEAESFDEEECYFLAAAALRRDVEEVKPLGVGFCIELLSFFGERAANRQQALERFGKRLRSPVPTTAPSASVTS